MFSTGAARSPKIAAFDEFSKQSASETERRNKEGREKGVVAMAIWQRRNLGMLCLGVWLILEGLLPLLSVNFPMIILHVLAIAAGVLILLER